MNFDPGFIFASLIVSGVGYIVYKYGRASGRLPHMLTGAAMLVYPYFVSSVSVMLLICAGLLGSTWLAGRYGY